MRINVMTCLLIGVLMSTSLPGAASPASAAGGRHCTFEADVELSPGVSVKASSGSFVTVGFPGETAELTCDGEPAGTFAFTGGYGTTDPDACQNGLTGGGEGRGHNPAIGPDRVRNTLTFVYGKPSTAGGLVAGTFEGDHYSGTFQVTPTAGDCVAAPITRAKVTGEGILR